MFKPRRIRPSNPRVRILSNLDSGFIPGSAGSSCGNPINVAFEGFGVVNATFGPTGEIWYFIDPLGTVNSVILPSAIVGTSYSNANCGSLVLREQLEGPTIMSGLGLGTIFKATGTPGANLSLSFTEI